ncbi:MAG: flagellar hook-length control protein FliK [Roseburia sp.]|nr:flagellar hook-length control protein FliK [Roseburia sp.]
MRLADIFQRNSQTTESVETARLQSYTERGGLMNRQIQSLVPGQTIQGEIVSRTGNEIQVRMADDILLHARLDQNMNLEIGKILSFQVKNNGRSLLLSPLFTNTAMEGNVLKALDMASLPANQETVKMAGQMMEAGLPVDKNSLQQVFREMNLYPEAETQDIVDLHKLGLPVNESSLSQIGSYKNFNHQLLQGMNDLLLELSQTLESMQQGGDIRGAAQLYLQIFELISTEEAYGEKLSLEAEGDTQQTGRLPETDIQGESGSGETDVRAEVRETREIDVSAEVRESQSGSIGETVVIREAVSHSTEEILREALMRSASSEGNATEAGKEILTQALARAAQALGEDSPEDSGKAADVKPGGIMQNTNLSQVLSQALSGETAVVGREQLALIRELLAGGLESKDEGLLRELLGSKEVKNILAERLETLFTASPEEIEDSKSVDALYQRLDRQLKGLGKVLEGAGQTDSGAYKVVQNMNQNLDFLQQINQVYTYVQLPVRMQQGNAHGDLYVYTNKKSLASKDGQISALLHLDMEYLGPVDVFVVLQSEKVNTRFYVQDEDMLDFLEEHMDLLTERLRKRGYDMQAQMQVREEEHAKGGMGAMAPLTPKESQANMSMLQQYAFDVRA